MRRINIKPVQIVGHCRANLTPEDEFQVDGVRIVNPKRSAMCVRALSYMPPAIGTLQRGTRFFTHLTCSECTGVQQENCVVFLLGHADKWALCQMLSEYDRLCRQCGQPESARQLKTEAMHHQGRDEYEAAIAKMGAALAELQRAAG